MVLAGTGLSTDPDPARAAAAAARAARAAAGLGGGARPAAALVFATPPHRAGYARIARAVREATGAAALVGASALGVLEAGREVEGGPAVGVLVLGGEGVEARPVFARGLVGRSAEVAGAVAAMGRGAGALLLFPDPYGFEAGPFFEALARDLPGVAVLGGAAAEAWDHERTYQMCGDLVDGDAMAGLLLGGRLRVVAGVTQSCLPVGEPYVVTRASGNVVLELDGRPAARVLGDLLPSPLRGRPDRVAGHLFAGLSDDGGEYVVRNILGVDPDRGALAVAAPVAAGTVLTFTLRDAARARDDLKAMLADVARRAAGLAPRAALYVNCCARGRSLYRAPDVDSAFIAAAFPGLPLLGFASAAEIGPLGRRTALLQYSGVLALFCEPPA
jgi:small ligand-binding sensory domain FIST